MNYASYTATIIIIIIDYVCVVYIHIELKKGIHLDGNQAILCDSHV